MAVVPDRPAKNARKRLTWVRAMDDQKGVQNSMPSDAILGALAGKSPIFTSATVAGVFVTGKNSDAWPPHFERAFRLQRL